MNIEPLPAWGPAASVRQADFIVKDVARSSISADPAVLKWSQYAAGVPG